MQQPETVRKRKIRAGKIKPNIIQAMAQVEKKNMFVQCSKKLISQTNLWGQAVYFPIQVLVKQDPLKSVSFAHRRTAP